VKTVQSCVRVKTVQSCVRVKTVQSCVRVKTVQSCKLLLLSVLNFHPDLSSPWIHYKVTYHVPGR